LISNGVFNLKNNNNGMRISVIMPSGNKNLMLIGSTGENQFWFHNQLEAGAIICDFHVEVKSCIASLHYL